VSFEEGKANLRNKGDNITREDLVGIKHNDFVPFG